MTCIWRPPLYGSHFCQVPRVAAIDRFDCIYIYIYIYIYIFIRTHTHTHTDIYIKNKLVVIASIICNIVHTPATKLTFISLKTAK